MEEIIQQIRDLCHKAHALGGTVVVGFSTYDPKENRDDLDYTCAGSLVPCMGLARWLELTLQKAGEVAFEDES